MSRRLGWAVGLTVIAAWLQGTWLSHLQVGPEWPDLVLAVILLMALLRGSEAGMAAGLTGGLVMGWLCGQAGAAFLLSRVAIAWLISRAGERWHRENAAVQILAVVFGTVACEALFAVIHQHVLSTPDLAWRIGVRALLNAPLAPLVALIVARLPMVEEGL